MTQPSVSREQSSSVVLVSGLSLLAVCCWGWLYRWYALVDHYLTPGFALDRVPDHFASTQLRLTALLFVVLSVIYAIIYWLLRRMPVFSPTIKLALLGSFLLSGVINVGLYPVGAIDLFSYLGQLKLVYFYQQNPYLFTFLPTYAADPLTKFAPFLELPLIYGPAWVLLAGWPLVLAGFGNMLYMLVAYKLWSLVLLFLSGWWIYRTHDDQRHGWLGAYLLLGNPLVMFEAVGNAHNDVIMTMVLLAAVLALRRKSSLALPLIIVAALIKAFTVALIPVVLVAMYRQRWSYRQILISIVFAFVVGCAVIAPFWSGGAVVGGMLNAVARQQQVFSTVSLISLVQDYAQQHGAAELTSALRLGFIGLFVCVAVVILLTVDVFEEALAYILLLFYILISSFYPWYLIPAIGLLAFVPRRRTLIYVFVASALALISYPVNIWARFDAGLSLYQMRLCVAACLTLPVIMLLVIGIRAAIMRNQQLRATHQVPIPSKPS